MNELHAEKIIALLESIDSTNRKLLKKQEEADAMMEALASRFGKTEEEPEEKSTDAYFNSGLVKAARERSEFSNSPF